MIRTYLIATITGLMLAILSSAYWIGGREAREAQREMQQRIDVFERAKNADISSGNPDADRDWLRRRGE